MYPSRKKVILILCGVLFVAAVAGGLFYADRLSYGDSYSEQQRKLWNERREVYPLVWMLDRCDMVISSEFNFLGETMRMDFGKLNALEKIKAKKDRDLEAQQKKLCEREKHGFTLDFKEKPDLASLQAWEITIRECLERARRGDGDACLEMALHVRRGNGFRSDSMSWRTAHDMKYWLEQALIAKRAGALFLKHFGDIRMKQIIESVKIMKDGIYITGTRLPDVASLPGYEEFRQCMQNGDLLAYRVMEELISDYHKNPFLSELKEVLRAKARNGDVRAMEKFASLCFDRDVHDVKRDIMTDMESSFWSKNLIPILPRKKQYDVRNLLVRMGIIDVNRTATVKDFHEAAAFSLLGAQHGSLAGMDYWLRFGQLTRDYFSREDWEAMLSYDKCLLEHVYVPYVRQIDEFGGFIHYSRFLNSVDVYYDSTSRRQCEQKARMLLMLRGESQQSNFPDFAEKSVSDLQSVLDETISLYGADSVLEKALSDLEIWKTSPEKQAIVANKVEELTKEGDPLAQFVMGFLYEQGRGVPQDLGKAWASYSKAYDSMAGIGLLSIRFPDPTHGFKTENGYLQKYIPQFMLSMVVRYHDFPGRDEKVAYALATYLEEFSRPDYNAYLNYLLGRVYEDGIGTPPNKNKALEYYMRGQQDHPACAEACKSLGKSSVFTQER